MTLCPQTPPPKRKRIVSEDVLEAPGQKIGGGGEQNCSNAGLHAYSCCLVAARKHRISESEVENWLSCICEQGALFIPPTVYTFSRVCTCANLIAA